MLRIVVAGKGGECFGESARALQHELSSRGIGCRVDKKMYPDTGDVYFLFNSHVADPSNVPSKYFVFQSEQLSSRYFTSDYKKILRGALHIFDFSVMNAQQWNRHGVSATQITFPVSVLPETSYISPRGKPFPTDVLFYGAGNQRRRDLAKQFAQTDLSVNFDFSWSLFGERRDAVVDNAAVVINCHFYPRASLETHRINYLLSRGKVVVSERSKDPALDNLYRGMVTFCAYDELLPVANTLVNIIRLDPWYAAERSRRSRELLRALIHIDMQKVVRVMK